MYKVVKYKDVPLYKRIWWSIVSSYSFFDVTIDNYYVQHGVVFPNKQLIVIHEPELTNYGIRQELLKSKEWSLWSTELNAQTKSTFHELENPTENEN